MHGTEFTIGMLVAFQMFSGRFIATDVTPSRFVAAVPTSTLVG